MGLTRFPNGIFATPNIGGAGRLADIWASDNMFFVNGETGYGSDGNSGKEPGQAKASISGAISAATKDAVIYVKPQTTTASAQAYYRDNITIPKTKPNMSIIGCGAGGKNPNAYTGVQLKVSATTTTGNLITVNGAGLYLENMRLTGNSMTGTGSIVNLPASATSTSGGAHIRGCIFEAAVCAASLGTTPSGGAVTANTCTYMLIEDNTFYNCYSGVAAIGNYGTLGRVQISGNRFVGAPGSRDVDIHLYPGSSTYGSWVEIDHNVFGDGLPAYASGSILRFIKIVSTGSGSVMGNFFASTAASGAAQWGASGTQTTIPNTYFFAGNYANDGAMVSY